MFEITVWSVCEHCKQHSRFCVCWCCQGSLSWLAILFHYFAFVLFKLYHKTVMPLFSRQSPLSVIRSSSSFLLFSFLYSSPPPLQLHHSAAESERDAENEVIVQNLFFCHCRTFYFIYMKVPWWHSLSLCVCVCGSSCYDKLTVQYVPFLCLTFGPG